MADDLDDLSGLTIIEPNVNWSDTPKTGFDVSFTVEGFDGTLEEVFEFTEDKPEKFQYKITFKDKAEEKAFLEEWLNYKGRKECFWFVDIIDQFTVSQPIGNTTFTVEVLDNFFVAEGHERIFVKLKNGDRLTRKINSSVASAGAITLTLNTAWDRDILIDDIEIFTLMYLCRYDTDDQTITQLNSYVSETNIAILQLVDEQKAL